VKSHSNRRAPSLFVAAMLASLPAGAASVEVTVTDSRGARIADAVVWAMPKAAAPQRPRREAAVEQRDQRFSPLVSVVQTGTRVRFPNRDPVRHQVYSFSAAKPFEIKLYAGTSAPPILFDKAGEIVLGCNIHDDMLGYIYVVDTPWFAKTAADGAARIADLPGGDYELKVWHYAQSMPAQARAIRLRADETLAAALNVSLKAQPSRAGTK
jgi:plastocyanin